MRTLRRAQGRSGSAIFRNTALRTRPQIRWVEVLPLRLGANAMHHAGAYLATALQRIGHRLQEFIAAFHRQRPGGGHYGVEFGVG